MHVRLQVSWHTCVTLLAVSTPSPWYQTPTPRGGVRGGTPNTKSTYLVTGGILPAQTSASTRARRLGSSPRGPATSAGRMGNEEKGCAARYGQIGCAAPSSAPIGHEPPACTGLADFPTQLVARLELVVLGHKRAALTIPPKPSGLRLSQAMHGGVSLRLVGLGRCYGREPGAQRAPRRHQSGRGALVT